jgi:hypothetical protein
MIVLYVLYYLHVLFVVLFVYIIFCKFVLCAYISSYHQSYSRLSLLVEHSTVVNHLELFLTSRPFASIPFLISPHSYKNSATGFLYINCIMLIICHHLSMPIIRLLRYTNLLEVFYLFRLFFTFSSYTTDYISFLTANRLPLLMLFIYIS